MNRRNFIQAGLALAGSLIFPKYGAPATIAGGVASGSGRANSTVVVDPPEVGTLDLSIVPEDRRTVWNPGIYGGIPADGLGDGAGANGVGGATLSGTPISPLGGTTDDRPDIQAALTAAGNAATKDKRKYVQLAAGTFNIGSPGLYIPSYVTLRGTLSGTTRQTILRPNGVGWASVYITGSGGTTWGTIYKVQGTLKRGDSTIQLDTVAGLTIGDLIRLDHLNDGDRSGKTVLTWGGGAGSNVYGDLCTTTGMSRDWDDAPTVTDGNVFSNSALSQGRADYSMTVDGGFKGQDYPDSPSDYPGYSSASGDRGWRNVDQTLEILDIDTNTNTITVYTPVTNYAQDAGASADLCGAPVSMWYYRDPEVYRVAGNDGSIVEYAGVEDLVCQMRGTPGNPTFGDDAQPSVLVSRARFCWIKNVESQGALADTGLESRGKHLRLEQHTYRCEITGCYVHGQYGYASGGAYGINIKGSQHLISDNISRNHNKPINLEMADGCVFAHNYCDNAIISSPLSWTESGIGTHASFCHNNLFEGNDTTNVTIDSTHGNNGFNVIYRNHLRGYNTLAGAPSEYVGNPSGGLRRALMVDFLNWETTSIGNVCFDNVVEASNVETSGHSTNWDDYAIPRRSIYLCGHNGWSASGVTRSCVDDDFALGNLHYHMDRHWISGGSTLYSNPGNAVSTLSDSLYRATTPSYFSTYTYPPIDPEQTTIGAQVATIPARDRYDSGDA